MPELRFVQRNRIWIVRAPQVASPLSVPIVGFAIDNTSLNRFANNGDIWPTTVADDLSIITSGNDGDGFDGVDTRGLDVNRLILADPTASISAAGTEVFSKADVYSKGIISVDGTLFMAEQDRTTSAALRIGRSTDHGASWFYPAGAGWDYQSADFRFCGMSFVMHDPDNSVAQDGYVYMVAPHSDDGAGSPYDRLEMARAPKATVDQVGTHEYLTGFDVSGNPLWSATLADVGEMFRRTGEIHWGPTIHYNAPLNRYLLAFFTDSVATLAVYEGPKPWGPWTLVTEIASVGGDTTEKFMMNFVSRPGWLSSDGLTWWFVLSGLLPWDSFNVLKATLTVPGTIESVAWDCASLITSASDSDIWPVTWADDDKQYTAWGDGEGFSLGTRVAYGIASIEGSDPTTAIYTDILRGDPTNGKISGLLSLNGVLYVIMNEQNGGHNHSLRKSTDHGLSLSAPIWTRTTDPFPMIFVQQGKDHGSAIDGYVYATGADWATATSVYLFRVLAAQIEALVSWEVFTGFDGSGNPTWSTNFANKQPIFSDASATSANGAGHTVVTYFPPLNQFVLTFHAADDMGSFTIARATKPWGPWTTIATYTNWCSEGGALTEMLMRYVAPKWIGTVTGNTLDFWITFSATGIWDRFNARKGTLTVA